MNLFVGNIDFHVREQELGDLFAEFGEVASARIITDRETRRSRGFGFVEMPNDAEAQAALEKLNGHDLAGRELSVRVAEERQPREERPRRDFRRY